MKIMKKINFQIGLDKGRFKKMPPPFEITPKILNLVSDISLKLGKLEIKKDLRLRKISKIKTISSTLLIENIDADEEKITAILENKKYYRLKKS